MNQYAPQVVSITTRNTGSLTMGIISIVIGVMALLVGWIPFLGLLAIPFAVIGGLLAGIGVLVAMAKGFKGFGMPVLGGLICVLAIALPIMMTSGASAVVADSAEKVSTEMNRQRESVRNEVARVEAEQSAANATYITDGIELYDVNAEFMDSILYGKVPGVTFKLRNKGDRSLDQVEVTIYFKDATGAVIAEEAYHPVLVTEYSFSGDNKPLKPGYIWQMERGKFYAAKSVPNEWQEGSVTAEITDIEFSE